MQIYIPQLDSFINKIQFLYDFVKYGFAKLSFSYAEKQKERHLKNTFKIQRPAWSYFGETIGLIVATKNFSGRSRRPIIKKLRIRPIMFGFGHCLVAMPHSESLAPTGLYVNVGVVFSTHLHITKRYSTDMVNLSLKQSGSGLYGFFFQSIVHVSNYVRFLL